MWCLCCCCRCCPLVRGSLSGLAAAAGVPRVRCFPWPLPPGVGRHSCPLFGRILRTCAVLFGSLRRSLLTLPLLSGLGVGLVVVMVLAGVAVVVVGAAVSATFGPAKPKPAQPTQQQSEGAGPPLPAGHRVPGRGWRRQTPRPKLPGLGCLAGGGWPRQTPLPPALSWQRLPPQRGRRQAMTQQPRRGHRSSCVAPFCANPIAEQILPYHNFFL